ncbi:DNA polymerase III subunit delta [Sulfobacillus acidophilus]|uniref:DNA polymerase III subunit delta n=1 Tax=Sulfobacillus acidophilus TaxID=53633 RepID=A0ABS3AWZ4_9FIRM|nr:DNA polymerase III subunit delta [Sulfobacillus acidophilus]
MPKNIAHWQMVVQKKSFPFVFALSGKERGFVQEAIAAVKTHVLQKDFADFNYEKVSAKDCSIENIINKANTLPMMAKFRLVEVQDADKLVADDVSSIEKYLQDPNKTTFLVFVFENVDFRQKVPKLLDTKACVFKFDPPKEEDMPKLILKMAQEYGLDLREGVCEILQMAIGCDLLMMKQAFEKLKLAVSNNLISVQDVSKNIANTKLEDAFLFGKAVALSNRKQALISLVKLQKEKEAPLRVTGLLAWQLRQVLQARVLIDENFSEYEIKRKLYLFGEQLKVVITAANKRSCIAHANRLAKISFLDQKLKTSRVPAWLWVERVVLQLCPKLK